MTYIYLLILVLTGILISSLIVKKASIFERISWGIGLGIILYSLEFFIMLSLKVSLTLQNVILAIILNSIILVFLNIKNKGLIHDISEIKVISKITGEKKYVFFAILFLGILISITAIFWPVSEWDALTLYDFRGKVFAEGLSFSDVQKLDNFDKYNAGYYFSYPPSTSLIHASFYILGSSTPQIIYPFIFFSLVLYFYKVLSKLSKGSVALFASCILMLINTYVNHASVPYTNLPYTYFYFVSTILLVEYINNSKKIDKLILSGIFLAGSTWIRSVEPFYIVNILTLMIYTVLQRKSFVNILIFAFPITFIKFVWSYIQKVYATQSFLNNLDYGYIISNLYSSIPQVIEKALSSFMLFVWNNGVIFSVLFLNIILYFVSKKDARTKFKSWILLIIFVNLGLILAGTIAIGILLPNRIEIYDSLSRFGIFLYPLILFVSGLSLGEFKINKESYES